MALNLNVENSSLLTLIPYLVRHVYCCCLGESLLIVLGHAEAVLYDCQAVLMLSCRP